MRFSGHLHWLLSLAFLLTSHPLKAANYPTPSPYQAGREVRADPSMSWRLLKST